MPSTRNRALRSVRNGNRSSSEGQQETPPNLRSSKDGESEVEETNNNDPERRKMSTRPETKSTTAISTKEQSSNGSRAKSGSGKGKNSPNNGLKAASWEDQVFKFLAENQPGMLDEDEVVSRMNRVVRSATQHFDSAKSIMNTVINDGVLFESCCEEAQNQAVIDDLLKELFGSLTTLDRHAISWVKRTIGASGRRQKSKRGLILGNTKRRLTRGMTKAPTATKNDDILYDAVREIEKAKGMTRRSERRLSYSSYNADDEGNRHKTSRHKRRANGDQLAASSSKRSRVEERFTRKGQLGAPVLDLAALESSRQKILEKWKKVDHPNTDFKSFLERSKKRLPSPYTQMGITHRYPEWKEVQEYFQKLKNVGVEVLLREQMKGQLTRFLVCEYFYSDLDKAWFNSEEVLVTQRDPEGLPTTTCWYATKTLKRQRQVPTRRFSKHFIHDEIKERNKYRQAVRFFQQHETLLDNVSFPFDVAKPVTVGTSVAAWNKKRQIICRGTVVSHDATHAMYSVDFGEQDEAFQEVPDSHVATIGGGEVFRSSATNHHSLIQGERSSLSLLDDTKTKAHLLKELQSLSRFDPSRQAVFPRNAEAQRITGAENAMDVKDKVAERDALICLTDSVDKLLRKKEILLESLEGLTDDTQDDSKRKRRLWLKDSFEKIDACLNTMLRYAEMFYGAAYLPNHRVGHPSPFHSREGFKGAFDRLPNLLCFSCGKEIGNMFAEFSELSTDLLISEVHPSISNKSEMHYDDDKDVGRGDGILSIVGQILLSSSFASSGITSNEITTAVSSRMNSLTIDPEIETCPLSDDDDDDFMASAHSARRDAIFELTEAAALLHAEVALAAL